MRHSHFAVTAAAVLLLSAVTVSGQELTVQPDEGVQVQSDDEKAIRRVAESYLDAFHRGDAAAMAAHWTEDGDFINIRGERIRGRGVIEKKFDEFFSQAGNPRLNIDIGSIRFVAPDVAVEDGTVEVVPAPPGSPGKARYTIIYVKRDGKWLVESLRDVAIAETSNYGHLKELEWMIGEWADAAGGDRHAVHSSCRWTVNRNFIIREFVSRLDDNAVLRGTQIIGWDPRTGKIRSWVFDSNGDILQGIWTRKGNRWSIKESGVLRDGREVKALDILTRVDDNTVTFQSVRRTADGRPLADIEEVEIRRKTE